MTSRMALVVVPDAICMLMCAWAVATDLKRYEIPNWLTLGGMLFGPVLNAALAGWYFGSLRGAGIGLLGSLGGELLMLLVFGLFGTIGFVGMGDVKLSAAVGALLGWPLALVALAYITVCGGVLAVAFAIGRHEIGQVLHNIRTIAGRSFRHRRSPSDPPLAAPLHRIPYALAIFMGVAWTVLGRYVPAVRWP